MIYKIESVHIMSEFEMTPQSRGIAGAALNPDGARKGQLLLF